MLPLQRTTRKPQVAGGTVSDVPKSYPMNPVVVNATVKIATGAVLIGAGTVLQNKGLTTLGQKVLGK